MCDLMWSDPEEMSGWGISPRGAVFLFGKEKVDDYGHHPDEPDHRSNGSPKVERVGCCCRTL